NVPRNFARGFGAWQMNLGVRREFPIYEGLKLQLRAEAFNVFNHPNFGTINGGHGQGNFGLATGTRANSLGVLSPLYQMGGPRSMQFALKVVFSGNLQASCWKPGPGAAWRVPRQVFFLRY